MSLLLYCVLNKCHFHWPVALFTDILLWFLCPHILWRKLVSCFFTESYYFARGRRQRCDADCHTNLQFCLHTLSLPQGTVLLYSTLLYYVKALKYYISFTGAATFWVGSTCFQLMAEWCSGPPPSLQTDIIAYMLQLFTVTKRNVPPAVSRASFSCCRFFKS